MRDSELRAISVAGSLPGVLLPLLEALRQVDPGKASLIFDVNWYVVEGVRNNEIKDSQMLNWVLEDIIDGFDKMAPKGTHFRCLGGTDLWGYWRDDA